MNLFFLQRLRWVSILDHQLLVSSFLMAQFITFTCIDFPWLDRLDKMYSEEWAVPLGFLIFFYSTEAKIRSSFMRSIPRNVIKKHWRLNKIIKIHNPAAHIEIHILRTNPSRSDVTMDQLKLKSDLQSSWKYRNVAIFQNNVRWPVL